LNARDELNLMRTVQLPAITTTEASADFDVLVVAGGKIEGSNFVRGSDVLRNAAKNLESAKLDETFPPTSTAHVIRRGILSCSSYSGCSFVFYPPSAAAGVN
jgi:hypothetical protein